VVVGKPDRYYTEFVAHPVIGDCMMRIIAHLRFSCSTTKPNAVKWSMWQQMDWTFMDTFRIMKRPSVVFMFIREV
jgi:hypothetical protein